MGEQNRIDRPKSSVAAKQSGNSNMFSKGQKNAKQCEENCLGAIVVAGFPIVVAKFSVVVARFSWIVLGCVIRF